MVRKIVVLVVVNLVLAGGAVFGQWHTNCDMYFLAAARRGDINSAYTGGASGGIKAHLEHSWGNINAQDPSSGETGLIIAAKRNDLPMVKTILEWPANNPINVNLADTEGMTALMYCLKGDFSQGVEEILKKDSAAIDNQAGRKKYTPLHYAVESHLDDMVELLLKQGANTLKVDSEGRTAFMIAVENEDSPMMKIFGNSRGFDPAKRPDDGIPPLLWALQKKMNYSLINRLVTYCPTAIYSVDDFGKNAFDYVELLSDNQGEYTRIKERLQKAERDADLINR